MLNQPIIASSTGGGSSGGSEKYYDYVIHNQEELDAFLKEHYDADTKTINLSGLAIRFVKNKDHNNSLFLTGSVEWDFEFDPADLFGMPMEEYGNYVTFSANGTLLDFSGCYVEMATSMFAGDFLMGRCTIIGGMFNVDFDYGREDPTVFRVFSWCTLIGSAIYKISFNDGYIVAENCLMTGCTIMSSIYRLCGFSGCYIGAAQLDCCNVGLSCQLNSTRIITDTTKEKVESVRSDVTLTVDTINVKNLNYT